MRANNARPSQTDGQTEGRTDEKPTNASRVKFLNYTQYTAVQLRLVYINIL